MSHRSIIKVLIVIVISIVVVWSVVNISDYAYTFHANWVVYSMGIALGTANALSVYAYVMAKTPEVQRPAVLGIILFGGMSAVLQVLLYLQVGAPMLAALAFGCFGPVAEGVLAWLHAALSEEQEPTRKASKQASASNSKQVQGGASTQQEQASSKQTAISLQQVASKTDAEIATIVKVSRQSVNGWRNNGKLESKILERLPELATISTNGKEHSHG